MEKSSRQLWTTTAYWGYRNSCLQGDSPVFLEQECIYSDGYQNGSYGWPFPNAGSNHWWVAGLESVWSMIRNRVWTKQATGLPYDALLRRLFLHDYIEESRWLKNFYKDRTGAESNSSGRIVRHGLQVKPLRGPQVNRSVLCTSMDLISSMLCHGNGQISMRI